jgi:hypothetical protein
MGSSHDVVPVGSQRRTWGRAEDDAGRRSLCADFPVSLRKQLSPAAYTDDPECNLSREV